MTPFTWFLSPLWFTITTTTLLDAPATQILKENFVKLKSRHVVQIFALLEAPAFKLVVIMNASVLHLQLEKLAIKVPSFFLIALIIEFNLKYLHRIASSSVLTWFTFFRGAERNLLQHR